MLEKELVKPTKETIIGKSITDFSFFIEHIFSKSIESIYGEYVGGEYIDEVAKYLQNNRRTIRVGPKDHFKSSSMYAHVMWELLRVPFTGSISGHYFSYKEKMARYHLKKIKNYIAVNEYYDDLIDYKGTADAVIEYAWNIGNKKLYTYTLQPQGLLGFTRGTHDERIYVDDPLQDPKNRMNLTVINHINEVMRSTILDMPTRGGQLHIVGTPQTRHDFFFDDDFTNSFTTRITPAVKSWKKKEVIWPEYMSFEKLKSRRKTRGTRIFNREYMCSPAWSENSFLNQKQLEPIFVEKDLGIEFEINNKILQDCDIIAGWDIGRKVHPSHFGVWAYNVQNGEWKQLHQKWMDQWPITSMEGGQVEYILRAIKKLHISKLYYDATRGELAGLEDSGQLPPEFVPVIFTAKKKNELATALEKHIIDKKITFIDNLRQMNQMLAVDNDLNCEESPEGHGDCFWSNAMAIQTINKIKTYAKPVGW